MGRVKRPTFYSLYKDLTNKINNLKKIYRTIDSVKGQNYDVTILSGSNYKKSMVEEAILKKEELTEEINTLENLYYYIGELLFDLGFHLGLINIEYYQSYDIITGKLKGKSDDILKKGYSKVKYEYMENLGLNYLRERLKEKNIEFNF
jgi:hypothetical protein